MQKDTDEFEQKPQYVQSLIELRNSGSDRHSIMQALRMLLAIIVIVLTSIMIGLNELQDIEVDGQKQTGGGVREMEARGFAIPFLVAAVGFVLWDSYKLIMSFLKKKQLVAQQMLPDKHVYELDHILDRKADALLDKYGLSDAVLPPAPLRWLVYSSRKAPVFEALYKYEQHTQHREEPKSVTIKLQPPKKEEASTQSDVLSGDSN